MVRQHVRPVSRAQSHHTTRADPEPPHQAPHRAAIAGSVIPSGVVGRVTDDVDLMPGPVQVNTDPQLRQSFAAPLIGDDLTNPGVDRERIALPTTVVDPDVPLVVNRGPNASTAVPAAAPG